MNSIKIKRTAKSLSVASVILVIIPFIYSIASPKTSGQRAFYILLPAGLVISGYFIQAFAGRVFNFERSNEDIELDGKMQYLSVPEATPPVIICLMFSIPVHLIIRMIRKANEGKVDLMSLDLYIIPLFFSLVMIIGAVLWFYPYHQITRLDNGLIFGLGFAADTAAVIFYSEGRNILIVCFLLFLLTFFLGCNIRSVEISLSRAKFKPQEEAFRKANIAFTVRRFFVILAAAAIIFSVITLIYNGIFYIKKDVDEAQKEIIDDNDYNYELITNEKEEYDSESRSFLSKALFRDEPSEFGIFCGIVVVSASAVLSIYLIYRKHPASRFFRFLNNIRRIFAKFFSLLFYSKESSEPELSSAIEKILPIDEKTSDIKTQETFVISAPRFYSELEKRKDICDRYAFAYAVYAELLTKTKYGILKSDTPREITGKLITYPDFELETLTPIYEEIRYQMEKTNMDITEDKLNILIKHIAKLLKR